MFMRSVRELLNWYSRISPKAKSKPPYSHVCQLGDPVLRTPAKIVPPSIIKSHEMEKIVKHLKGVMDIYGSCGIAAPQIGVDKRIFIMEFNPVHAKFHKDTYAEREMSLFPQTVVINPAIKVVNYKKVSFPEACESLRGYSAVVPRYQEILLSGYDERGLEIKYNLKGWLARIAQHELDHLDGKFFIDFMEKETFHCMCWREVNEYHGKITLPFRP